MDNIAITDFVHNGASFKRGFANINGDSSLQDYFPAAVTPLWNPAEPDPGSKLAGVKTLPEEVVYAKKKSVVAAAAAVAGLPPATGKKNKFLLPGLLIGVAVIAGVTVYFLTKNK